MRGSRCLEKKTAHARDELLSSFGGLTFLATKPLLPTPVKIQLPLHSNICVARARSSKLRESLVRVGYPAQLSPASAAEILGASESELESLWAHPHPSAGMLRCRMAVYAARAIEHQHLQLPPEWGESARAPTHKIRLAESAGGASKARGGACMDATVVAAARCVALSSGRPTSCGYHPAS